MNRTPGIRLFLVIAALTVLLAAPAAEARVLQFQGPGAGEAGWFSAALQWLEQALGLRRPAPRAGSSTPKEDTSGGSGTGTDDGGGSTMGGSCIDPQGNPRPWCAG